MAFNDHVLWGFKIVSGFDKLSLSEITKSKIVSQNMNNILINLPGETKTSIISKCINNKFNDYVCLHYLDQYHPGCEQNSIRENINAKRKNHVAEPDSNKTFRKENMRVEFADSEDKEKENWTLPKKKTENKKSRAEDVKPELPEEIKSKIGKLNGRDIRWLFTKRLFPSDVNKKVARFSMTLNQIDKSFFKDDERKKLDRKGGIEVRLVGPTGEVSKKVLKKWVNRKNSGKIDIVYGLINGWTKDILEKNGLEVDQLVHIWSFRQGTNLWFALVKVDE